MGLGALLGRQPRSSRPGGLQAACDAAEQFGFGASGGEADADPGGGLGDAPGDLDQPHAQGGELRRGERLRFGNGIAHRQHQPISGGVQYQADLISQGGSAAGAVGGELALVQLDRKMRPGLDQVLRLAARAV